MADRYLEVEPSLVARCQAMAAAMAALGYRMVPVQGLRTVAVQQALWQQGRTAPGHIVTNSDGIHTLSNHQAKADGFGHAVDFAFLDHNGVVSWDPQYPWALLGAMAEALGLVWGGRFKTIQDLGHVELPVHAVLTPGVKV